MRIGIGTIFWGRRIDDLDYTLELIARCGYQGVEFAQHHSQIYVRGIGGRVRPVGNIDALQTHLERFHLRLIGLVAGSLEERRAYLDGTTTPYLYLDRWPKDEKFQKHVANCLAEGFTIALHPHWLMPIRKLRHAIDIIRAKERESGYAEIRGHLRLLLDTAHTIIAEDDPVQAIRTGDTFRHICAVHLKDWRPDYGRWSHRYAHGFCSPGSGIVNLKEVMNALHERNFRGWLVMEQDHFAYRRETTVLAGAQWMENHGSKWGIAMRPNAAWVSDRLNDVRPNPFAQLNNFNTIEFRLGRELARAVAPCPDAPQFYAVVARRLCDALKARAVKVWSYNPLTGEFCLLGMHAEQEQWGRCLAIIKDRNETTDQLTLAGQLVSHPQTCEIDLSVPDVAERFADKVWLELIQHHARWMTVLPVFNTSNKHQLRFLITVFTSESILSPDDCNDVAEPAVFDAMAEAEWKRRRLAGELERLGEVVALWADYLTDQACSAASGGTNHLCGSFKGGVTEFIDALMAHLEERFECNSVTIFLRDMTGKRLEPAGRSDEKLDWHASDHFYTEAMGLTGEAFKEREMVFNSRATTGNAREKRPPDDTRDEILFAPLVRPNGECHGVVRLHNKDRTGGSPASSMFTDDDAARLDAMIQTALPYLELLMLQEKQNNGIMRMIHEYQAPLVAIRGAVDAMRRDLVQANRTVSDIFRRDFPDLIVQWADLLGRLTRNWQVFAGGRGALPPKKRRTLLRADVVVPVLHQVRGLLAKGFRLEFDYTGFDEIPPLWIDRDQFQQVFFNLLSNSCKYGGGNETVRVEITAGEVWGSYCISYSDWGRGIPDEVKEKIFLPNFRAKSAILSDMSGQGLGLFVVRSIIEGHGGTIRVISTKNPTTFEIILPRDLKQPSRADEYRDRRKQ